MIRSIRKHLIYAKMAMARSNSYLSLMNAGMILFIFLSSLKDKGYITLDLGKYLVAIYIVGITVLLCIGYIEMFILKGMHVEQSLALQLNPEWIDLKTKVDFLYLRASK